jgi:hypothetical protein
MIREGLMMGDSDESVAAADAFTLAEQTGCRAGAPFTRPLAACGT